MSIEIDNLHIKYPVGYINLKHGEVRAGKISLESSVHQHKNVIKSYE